jgi:hypothetical protein
VKRSKKEIFEIDFGWNEKFQQLEEDFDGQVFYLQVPVSPS